MYTILVCNSSFQHIAAHRCCACQLKHLFLLLAQVKKQHSIAANNSQFELNVSRKRLPLASQHQG